MKNLRTTALFVAAFSSAIALAFLIVLKLFLQEKVPPSEQIYLVIIMSIAIFLIFMPLVRIFGKKLAKVVFSDQFREADKELIKLTGITKIYPNIDFCIDEICDHIASSEKVSIFVQIGRDLLSGKGVFYEYLKKNSNAKEIRILHSSKTNPYLSEERALERGHGKISEWRMELTSIEATGKLLATYFDDGKMETRTHNEGFIWRIFLFDMVCFVQPYIYDSHNADRAPVLRMEKREHSLFVTFQHLFEQKWIENTPSVRYMIDLIRDAYPIVVTALCRIDSLYIFVVPQRYLSELEVKIQAPGGKLDKNENYVSGLKREVHEEMGCAVKVNNSSYTTYIHEGAHLWQWKLSDNPAPYCILKRDPENDARDKRIEWILLYHTDLIITSIEEIRPVGETKAVVCLSLEALNRVVSSSRAITVSDIENMSDGSRIISSEKLNSSARIIPRGMVPVISTMHHSYISHVE